ncbi:MAG TPA: alkaline phosphatase family protein [Acidimicrobiia bacterium]|jgi:phospholipase C|nr:alkaline phosphatase family protein [Acidimicrobiia bacterium]
MDRRDFLRSAALVGAGVALRPWPRAVRAVPRLPAPPSRAAAPTPEQLRQIQHVVILMQENRSYDHYFGSYRHGRGFDDHPRGSPGVFAQVDPRRTTGSPRGQLLPWHLDTATMHAACTDNPSHEWVAQHQSWNQGAMDRWVTTHSLTRNDGPLAAPQIMGYYTRADLPLYYALADAFTLCDHYFCSVMAPTDPNRHYWMSATIDPNGQAGGPVVTNAANVSAIAPSQVVTNSALYTWTTMPERLQAQGVSWKVYQAPGSLADTTLTNNILVRYRQYSDPGSVLYRNAFVPTYPQDFLADVEAGTLPSVSWVLAPPQQDEHPPAPSNTGARVVGTVVETLLRNPKVWAQTVLFVTFDENGGFFDHVAPPTAPPGTPDEYVTTSPLPAGAGGISGPIGLGFRVPLLVVSPFSRGGRINSDPGDHTSLLRFLETRFGVEVPNLSAWRRSVTSDLTGTLDLTRPRLSVPALPVRGLSDKLVARECATRDEAPPLVQHLPTQHA